MGIYYDYSGAFAIAPPLTEAQVDAFNTEIPYGPYRSDTRPRFYPWIVSPDGASLAADEDELKNLGNVEETNLARVVAVLHRMGHHLSGTIYGEHSEGYQWCYKAADDGTVTMHEAETVYRAHGTTLARKPR